MDKAQIVNLLLTNDRAVGRALLALNARQTADERASESTRHQNGMGFRSCDARVGTSMAEFFSRTGFLTPKQIAYWRKPQRNGAPRITVYAGQLLEVAKARAAEKVAV